VPCILSGAGAVACPPPLCCLSVDVEEYFHCEAFARTVAVSQWSSLARRAEPFLERIGERLAAHGSRATFFVLGWTARYLAPLLRRLAAAGHEIACHGYSHTHLRRLGPAELANDLRRARGCIEDHLGVRPRGYRAPTFSITRRTAWALDVLAAEGFTYDSSIFPVHHDRYGIPGAPVLPFWAEGPSGARLLEFPPLTLELGPLRVPLGGGGYLRLLPGAFLRAAVAYRAHRRQPVMLYVHPWELDSQQPALPAAWPARWRHRLNLHTTAAKLESLLRRFRFDTAERVLSRFCDGRRLPVMRVGAPSAGRQALPAQVGRTISKWPPSGTTSETTCRRLPDGSGGI